jgi:glyoxylase-like metal-dependent hydrolase (beta-lactamase superfamily II)
MKQLRQDLYAIRGWAGWTHLLVRDGEVVLMDSGFANEYRRIRRAVDRLGKLTAILLTHGHLDHTANGARLQDWSGAKIYAPAGDELHIAGTFPYRGAARVCGALEWVGRRLVRYRPPRVDAWLNDGDELPFWGGLRVVALPGHTAGHVGYYSPAKRVFFAGDTFAVSWRIALPPGILNTDSQQMRESFLKLTGYDVGQFVPCHYLWLPADTVARVRRACYKRRHELAGTH